MAAIQGEALAQLQPGDDGIPRDASRLRVRSPRGIDRARGGQRAGSTPRALRLGSHRPGLENLIPRVEVHAAGGRIYVEGRSVGRSGSGRTPGPAGKPGIAVSFARYRAVESGRKALGLGSTSPVRSSSARRPSGRRGPRGKQHLRLAVKGVIVSSFLGQMSREGGELSNLNGSRENGDARKRSLKPRYSRRDDDDRIRDSVIRECCARKSSHHDSMSSEEDHARRSGP